MNTIENVRCYFCASQFDEAEIEEDVFTSVIIWVCPECDEDNYIDRDEYEGTI